MRASMGIGIMSACLLLCAGCGKQDLENPDTVSDVRSEVQRTMVITTAFSDDQTIPLQYCNIGVTGGKNISLPVQWQGAPEDTRSFALTLIDHAAVADDFVHWMVIDIPNDIVQLEEGGSGKSILPSGAIELTNDFRQQGYGGPQPPAGSGIHDYELTVYALNVDDLALVGKSSEAQLLAVLRDRILAFGTITGEFSR